VEIPYSGGSDLDFGPQSSAEHLDHSTEEGEERTKKIVNLLMQGTMTWN
jgi:hypothetical protein